MHLWTIFCFVFCVPFQYGWEWEWIKFTNVNTGTSTSAASRSKNAPGNRIDIGWKHGTDVLGNGKKVKCNYCSKMNNGRIFRFKHHLAGTKWDSEPCASVPEEVKMLMMKIVVEVANTSEKRRKLDSIHE